MIIIIILSGAEKRTILINKNNMLTTLGVAMAELQRRGSFSEWNMNSRAVSQVYRVG